MELDLPSDKEIKKVERKIGYEFKNKDLIIGALISGSCYKHSVKHHIEKPYYNPELKKEGHKFLQKKIPGLLQKKFKNLTRKELNKVTTANIGTEKLARIIIERELTKHIRRNNEEVEEQIENLQAAFEEYPIHSNGNLTELPKTLASRMKAIVGAILTDSEDKALTLEIFEMLAEPLVSLDTLKKNPTQAEIERQTRKLQRQIERNLKLEEERKLELEEESD